LLRRWYGIWFAVIGIADTPPRPSPPNSWRPLSSWPGTPARCRVLHIHLALPVLATANTPAQRKLGRYWKKLQRMTVIWFFAVVLLLLDGFKPSARQRRR
jgi:hypothetical protein